MAELTGIKERIISLSSELFYETRDIRRHLHMYPELSYKEFLTSAYIGRWLKKNNIEFSEGVAGTGIIAEIKGKGVGTRVIGVRAELDALPITEKNITGYESMNPGVMHACGHDAHMAMLLGVAGVLKRIADNFGGTVLLIFQPGEEKNPGGARLVIESGAFDNLKPDMFIAHHILPELETGKVGYKPGRYMASCDEIYLTVRGTGGHAALPGLTTDQILIASNLVIRLKKEIDDKQKLNQIPTVLGIGKIIGDGATNVIPEKVEIAGTFRTFDEKWRAEALDKIREVSESTAREFRVQIDVNITEGYPVLVNDETLTQKAIEYSTDLLGADMIETYDIRMSSDDFSFYSAIAPSLYYRVGIKSSGTEMRKLHTAEFDIDENGMKTGVANMSWLLYNFLRNTDF
ncbi:MAG TPA: M20 family metallopeptidase [Bacteroidales bacterium]|nr:M20 family metallopeptidase [Bacteroidales bacterium]